MEYLAKHAVPNVFPVCDPAFLMKPRQPVSSAIGFELDGSHIGINLSPLMARYVTGGDSDRWERLCAEIVERTHVATKRPILLIPHVTARTAGNDDFSMLQRVKERLALPDAVVRCLPGTLSAAELKWAISKCPVVAGARTHATIAGLSSCVPTLSLAYSIKAYGINKDIFGTHEYCLGPEDLLHPERIAAKLATMLGKAAEIRAQLQRRIPEVEESAYKAGALLKDILAA